MKTKREQLLQLLQTSHDFLESPEDKDKRLAFLKTVELAKAFEKAEARAAQHEVVVRDLEKKQPPKQYYKEDHRSRLYIWSGLLGAVLVIGLLLLEVVGRSVSSPQPIEFALAATASASIRHTPMLFASKTPNSLNYAPTLTFFQNTPVILYPDSSATLAQEGNFSSNPNGGGTPQISQVKTALLHQDPLSVYIETAMIPLTEAAKAGNGNLGLIPQLVVIADFKHLGLNTINIEDSLSSAMYNNQITTVPIHYRVANRTEARQIADLYRATIVVWGEVTQINTNIHFEITPRDGFGNTIEAYDNYQQLVGNNSYTITTIIVKHVQELLKSDAAN